MIRICLIAFTYFFILPLVQVFLRFSLPNYMKDLGFIRDSLIVLNFRELTQRISVALMAS